MADSGGLVVSGELFSYNIKGILNTNWFSKQNKKLAIRLKRFHGRFGRSIEIVIKITFHKLYLTNPRCVAWRQKLLYIQTLPNFRKIKFCNNFIKMISGFKHL